LEIADEVDDRTSTVDDRSSTVAEPVAERTWDDDDEVVKQAFLAGSEEAFIRLYAKYEVALLYYCKRMLRDSNLAEDAFQEIWTRVFELRQRPGIVILHFRGLLFRSARNLCMNVLRMQRPQVSTSTDREEFMEAEPMTGEASTREMQDLMLKALARLPFDQRETFVLHEYSGFTYAEIAEMKETTERNVKVRAYRARMRLRKFIQGWLGLGETDDPVSYI
jgi:RNA polymerase sigma-70 factor (ECF subfamily)